MRNSLIAVALLLSASMPLHAQSADDVSIDVNVSSDKVVSGFNVTYTIVLANDGDDAGAFTVANQLPDQTTFVSCDATGGGVCTPSGNSQTIAFAGLASNGTAQITIVANVNCPTPDQTDITDVAEVQPATPDPDLDVFDNDSVTITVLNPAPKILDVAATPNVLWPPNHKFVNVNVAYRIEDNCGPIALQLDVASNEAVNGTGDGDTAPDWVVLDPHHVQLRAERAGTGTGRVYTITITATDSANQSSTANVTVSVPHDKP